MKIFTTLLFLFFFTLCANHIFAQVKIGDNAKTINPNSLLELESSTKGLLLPRLTNDQIKAMTNVPVGMLLFSSTDSALYLRKDTGWAVLGFKTAPAINVWASNGKDVYNTNAGKVGIGTSTPYSQLSNTPDNVFDAEGLGANANSSFTWVSEGAGYAAIISNLFGSGLLINTNSYPQYNVLEVSSGKTPLLNVLGDGTVGIGTRTPAAKLDVQGKVAATGFSGDGSQITGLQVSQVNGAAPIVNPSFFGIVEAPVFSGNGSLITGLQVSQVNGAAPINNPSFSGNINYSGTLNMGVQYIRNTMVAKANVQYQVYEGCPTGLKLIGGGGGAQDYNPYSRGITINYSGPDPDDNNQWTLFINNTSNSDVTVAYYAICAKVQ